MGGISPVLEAFLEGQNIRSQVLSRAQNAKAQSEAQKLRKQQLDETIRQFNERLKMDQNLYQLRQKEFEATRAARMGEMEHQFRTEIATGIRKPQTTPAAAPGRTDMVAIPGGGFQEVQGPQRPAEMVNAVQSIDTPYGPMNIPGVTSQEELQSSAFNQASRIKEMQEATEHRYKAQEIAQSNEARMSQVMERLRSAEQIASERNATSQMIAELRAQLAGAKSGLDQQLKLFTLYGDVDPERIKQRALEDVEKVKMGYTDLSELGTKANQALVSSGMGRFTAFGKKNRSNLETVSAASSKLINQVEEINKAISAPSSSGGVLGNLIQRYNPRSLVNQKTKLAGALVPDLAHSMGIASKQFDSNKEADRILNLIPSYSDRPDIRASKLIDLRDRPLSAMQSIIGTVSDKEQRINLWRSFLNDNPALLKQRLQYRPVYDKIMSTGTYDSKYWEPIKQTLGAR